MVLNKYQKVINQITRDQLMLRFLCRKTRKKIRKKLKIVANKHGYNSIKFSTLLKIKAYGKDHILNLKEEIS